MKVLIISSHKIPHIGGKSTHVENLVKGLNERDIDVTIFSPSNINKFTYLFWVKIRASIMACIFKNSKMYFFQLYRKQLMEFKLSLYKKFSKNFKNIDVINCQDTYSLLLAQDVYPDAKKVLTMHTYIGIESTLDNALKNKDKYYYKIEEIELKSLKYADYLISVDSRIDKHMSQIIKKEKLINLNKNKTIIKNFTDTDVFKPINFEKKQNLRKQHGIEDEKLVILSTRRLVEKNGVLYAVKAINEIKNKLNVILIILGSGPQEDQIKQYIYENGLENYVIMLGDIDNDRITEYYNLTDIAVVPSITVNGLQEATSLSALEAMSCELVVIASNIGGLKEIIDNEKSGILFEEKNFKSLSEKILDVFMNKDKKIFISKNARDYVVKNNSISSTAKNFEEIFNNVIKKEG